MEKLFTALSFLILLIISIVFGAIIYFLKPEDRNLLNIVTISSSAVTLLALIVALGQIIEVGTTAKQTETEVNKKLESFNQVLFLSEISTVNALINEVSTYLRMEKHELVIIKIKDIKRVLNIIINNHEKLNLAIDKEALRKLIINISIDSDSIEKRIHNSKNTIKTPDIIKNLDNTADLLHSIQSQIQVI